MCLKHAIQENWPQWRDRHDKVILQHDNTRPYVGQPVRTYLEGVKWQVLPHPSYSPDITPSHYHLFPSMQSAFTGEHFTSYESIQKWVDWIASKGIEFFTRGMRLLPEKWIVASDGKCFG
ncbi:hypothetical protein Trydic_g22514 [Trypoxylus dichotomus]